MQVRSLPLVKHARKRVKIVPPLVLGARLCPLTTQIEADLAPSFTHVLHGHFALWRRCKALKMLAFPASLRLAREQIDACHIGLSL